MATIAPPPPANIPTVGGNKDPFTWTATRADTINVDGLGLSKKVLTGDQAFAEIEKMAYQNPTQWAKIKLTLANMLAYNDGNTYTKATHAKAYNTNSPWSKADAQALQWALTQYHNINYSGAPATPSAASPTGLTGTAQTKPTFLSFAATTATKVKSTGYSTSTAASVPPLVPVHASADLTSAAQTAFAQTLGRSATPQEAQAFAKAFQDLENSYGQAKNDAKKQSVFSAPAQPIKFQQTGQSAIPAQNNVSTDQGALPVPPTPAIAAANFAAQTNPANASAQAAADGLGQFLSMLKGS